MLKQLLMKILTAILTLMLLVAGTANLHAARAVPDPVLPASRTKVSALPPAAVQYLLRLTPRHYEAATGRKLRRNEKLALRLYQWKLRRQLPDKELITERQRKLGKLSLIFGAGAFVLAIVPVIGLLCVPAAITGIILGAISLKGNSNINGILGIVFGGLFILLLALLITILVIAFAGFR